MVFDPKSPLSNRLLRATFIFLQSAVLVMSLLDLHDLSTPLSLHAILGLVSYGFVALSVTAAIFDLIKVEVWEARYSYLGYVSTFVHAASGTFALLSVFSGLAYAHATTAFIWPTLVCLVCLAFTLSYFGARALPGLPKSTEGRRRCTGMGGVCVMIAATIFMIVAISASTNVKAAWQCNEEAAVSEPDPNRLNHLITYYVQGEDSEWDYIPSGKDLRDPSNPIDITDVPGPNGTNKRFFNAPFISKTDKSMGNKVKKMRFVQYTDETYTTKVKQPGYLGLLNVVFKCEVGDTLVIVARNQGSYPMSFHPHGVFYDKAAEGASYSDKSNVSNSGDRILPGENFTYIWPCTVRSGPVEGEPVDASPWMLHGHLIGEDTNTGQIGAIVVYRLGSSVRKPLPNHPTLFYPALAPTPSGQPRQDFFMVVSTIDESMSHFFLENWNELTGDNQTSEKTLRARFKGEPNIPTELAFNVRYNTINGFMFNNMPRPVMNQGEQIYWYVGTFGDSKDSNRLSFDKYPVARIANGALVPHHDLFLLGGTSFTLVMNATKAGNYSMTNGNYVAASRGSTGSFEVRPTPGYTPPVPNAELGVVREYFIKAKEIHWNHCPDGPFDGTTGQQLNNGSRPGFPTLLLCQTTPEFFGPIAIKLVYRAYTDASFSVPKERTGDDEHLGLLGPIIRGVVGDTLKIHFYNNQTYFPLNLFVDGPVGDQNTPPVMPGETVIYEWLLEEGMGPSKDQSTSSIMWPYTSTFPDITLAPPLGLMGALIVTRAGSANAFTGRPLDCEREFIVFLQTTYDASRANPLYQEILKYHNETVMADYGIPAGGPPGSPYNDFSKLEWFVFNIDSHINGVSFGQLRGLTMRVGEKIRFHVFTMGDRFEIHSVTFHGNSVNTYGMQRDGVPMVTNNVISVDMVPEHLGKFSISCHVADHVIFGMYAPYEVLPADPADAPDVLRTQSPPSQQLTGVLREYFIAAEEVEWDYAPQGKHVVMGREFNAYERIWFDPGPMTIGHIACKARYVEYKDAAMTVKKPKPEKWAHTGILGPMLEVCVGDVMRVKFCNRASQGGVPLSIFPHGGLAQHENDTRVGAFPGQCTVYTWEVRDSAGPAEGTSSVIWPYHSWVAVLSGADFSSGLLGGVIVRERGSCNIDMSKTSPRGVDREFVVYMGNIEESASFYMIPHNLKKTSQGMTVLGASGPGFLNDPHFIETNSFFSINGYIYGNHDPNMTSNTPYTMKEGETVRWYAIGFGNRGDIHSEHWHAQTFISQIKTRIDIFNIVAGTVYITDMLADDPGIWLFHCHMGNHFEDGMSGLFEVLGLDQPNYLPNPPPGANLLLTFAPALGTGDIDFTYQLSQDGKELIGTLKGPSNLYWMGFGIGKSMQGADIIQASNNGGTWSVGDYYSVFEEMPRPDPDANNVQLVSVKQSGNVVEVTFRRPLAATGLYDKPIQLHHVTPVIFAYSTVGPGMYHGHNQRFQRSIIFGSLMDSSSTKSSTDLLRSSYTSKIFVIFVVHAVGMTFLWYVLAPLSFLMVRYFKHKPYWLKGHKISMGIVGVFTIVFAGLVMTQTGFQIRYAHGWLGIFIMSIIFIQIGLGIMAQHMRSTISSKDFLTNDDSSQDTCLGLSSLLWKNMVVLWHRYTGRILVIAGAINCLLGIRVYIRVYTVGLAPLLYAIWLAILVLAFTLFDVIRNISDIRMKSVGNATKKGNDSALYDPMKEGAGNELTMTLEKFHAKCKSGFMLVMYKGRVYDVASFAPMHPGGEYLIKLAVGKDITKAFEGGMVFGTGESNVHSKRARDILENCVLAKLITTNGNSPGSRSKVQHMSPKEMKMTFAKAHKEKGEKEMLDPIADSHMSQLNVQANGNGSNTEWSDKGQAAMFAAGDDYKTEMTNFDAYTQSIGQASRRGSAVSVSGVETNDLNASEKPGSPTTPSDSMPTPGDVSLNRDLAIASRGTSISAEPADYPDQEPADTV
eukprot:g83002.t1